MNWLILIFLLFASPALAMEHYTSNLQDRTGRAIEGATVTVYDAGTTDLADIYSDNDVTATKSNPFTTSSTGSYDFYAANGLYDIVFSKVGYTFVATRTAGIALADPTEISGGGGGGGGGSVTSVAATGGVETVTGSAITSTGTIRGAHTFNAQTGTSYTILTGDRGKTVTFNNSSSIAVTLPQAGTGFENGWFFLAKNIGAGTVTITPTTSTIDSATSLALANGQMAVIVSDGSNYQSLGKALLAEVQTLDSVFDLGKTINGANSLANAVRIGNGSTDLCLYTDATLGPQVRPCTNANIKTLIPTNFTWCLKDEEGALDIECVDPDAASTFAMYSYTAGYRPTKAIYFPAGALSTDGTQCAAPAEVTINSGAKRYTIICADNDSSTIYGEVAMPRNWDGGTVTMTGAFVQTAADTNNVNADVAMACRKDGDTINNTWGTEIAMDTAMGGSSKRDTVQTAAITPNGTCTGGSQSDPVLLQFRWQLDATGTTTAVATLHMVGFTIWYTETSRSN